MATKFLARTVIEGGRCRFNKKERRFSNRRARRRARAWVHAVRFDEELGEDTSVPPRQPVRRCHDDKLGAAERWLESFVGQPWADVRAEISRRFDVRTIAGQHIVYDHLLPSVQVGGCVRWYRHDFQVDEDGLLQRAPPVGWRVQRRIERQLPAGKVRWSWQAIYAWSGERKVGRRGDALFWFEPTATAWTLCSDPRCPRRHIRDQRTGERRHRADSGYYRQAGRLSPADRSFWDQLIDDVQERLRLGDRSGVV